MLFRPAGRWVACLLSLCDVLKQPYTDAYQLPSYIVPASHLTESAECWSVFCLFPGTITHLAQAEIQSTALSLCIYLGTLKQQKKLVTRASAAVDVSWFGIADTSSRLVK
ncbi:hypothetical protein L798_00491 [Zootermopsis nevadensis]|uniref:Secreted protein n=1 Tax=Zootermopsis nevadensis TaxID=136037 RepID=A0A067RQB7_ZOONE|nr:hypothetical protein L798_00491 [Zootermopsis nevadensis]